MLISILRCHCNDASGEGLMPAMQVPLGLSEAFATAMLAADKASANHTAGVSPTAIAETFVEGLQAAAANCTSRQKTTLQPRTEGWYK